MPHAEPWRKRKNGAEYGAYYGYAHGQIVNLGTQVYTEAKTKIRTILGLPPEEPHANGTNGTPPAAAPPSSRPSFLASWSTGKSTDTAEDAAPATPASPAIGALADGFAHAITRLNAAAVALSVRALANVKPGEVDPEHVEAMEKTWAAGLREMMELSGLRWWHILLAQNGSIALEMIQKGEKLPPKLNSPVEAPQTVPAA